MPGATVPRLGRARRMAGPVIVGAVAVGGVLLVHAVDPNQPGSYPTCPWLTVTGTFCPGCGSLRAVHALSSGDLAGALAMNPLTVVILPLVVALLVEWSWRAWTGRPAVVTLPSRAAWGFLGVTLAYWITRNLPQFAWLAPG